MDDAGLTLSDHKSSLWAIHEWLNANHSKWKFSDLPVFEFKLWYQFSLGFISIKAKIHLSRASGLKWENKIKYKLFPPEWINSEKFSNTWLKHVSTGLSVLDFKGLQV